MKLKELIKNLNYKHLENISDYDIKGISSNSNCIQPGYLFVAIKGRRFDGHNFLNQAIDRGAKAVIVEKNLPLKKKVAKILVGDSQAALVYVCTSFFSYLRENLRVIGITGTNGKTTVCYLIENILACAGQASGVIGTVNYRIGNKVYSAVNTTPCADILQSFLHEIVLAKYKYAIIEVSSHALAQRRVDGIAFSSAIFTNLSREHLDFHGSLANYFSCKLSLFKRLTRGAFAIINTDDIWGRRLVRKTKSRLLTFGIEHPAQIRAKNLKLGIEKTRFTAVTPRGNIEIESALIGRHNVYNILAAIGAAFVEDIDCSDIAAGIKRIRFIPGRLERVDCGQNFLVFVDYAHTEDALSKILKAVREISKERIVLVFGCGGDRDKAKRPKMGRVATKLADFSIITCDNPRSENPKQIISDILQGVNKSTNNCKVVLDRFQAILKALSLARNRDIVLIAGKGHESTQLFADKTIPFNDRKAVEEILQCLQSKKY